MVPQLSGAESLLDGPLDRAREGRIFVQAGALREAERAQQCIELIYVVHFCRRMHALSGVSPNRFTRGLHESGFALGRDRPRIEGWCTCLFLSLELPMLKDSLQNVPRRVPLVRILVVLGVVIGALIWLTSLRHDQPADIRRGEFSSQAKGRVFYPTAEQWATLTVEPVQRQVFRSERTTEGKIAVDEDRSTPIFSPYAGRVLKLFVKPGDIVTVGQPLFTVQATDMVQAQNDFISAATGLNKARSALNLAQIIDKRQRLLYEGKAVPLKEVQNARATLDAAESDVRAAAFRGREFAGKVSFIAPIVEKGRINARGQRNVTDVDVVEVLVDLTQADPLAVGMKVDVYFQPDGR
jgi:hypothetical protein